MTNGRNWTLVLVLLGGELLLPLNSGGGNSGCLEEVHQKAMAVFDGGFVFLNSAVIFSFHP